MYLPSRMTMRLIAAGAIVVIATAMHSPLGAKLVTLHASMIG
ncbi:hypothetical protein [Methyloceanibacter methanicus]|nr:hypothetical protein [Methyloceanibacter methanicus]